MQMKNWDLKYQKQEENKKKTESWVVDRSIRGSLVVDIDGDSDSFSASLKPVERSLLVSDDEGDVRGSVGA